MAEKAGVLVALGKVAGIGGIAVGAVVLLLGPLIHTAVPGLASTDRATAVMTIAVCAFGLGALGIVAWAYGSRLRPSTQRVLAGRDAFAAGKDLHLGTREISRGKRRPEAGADPVVQDVEAKRDAYVAARDVSISSRTGKPR